MFYVFRKQRGVLQVYILIWGCLRSFEVKGGRKGQVTNYITKVCKRKHGFQMIYFLN